MEITSLRDESSETFATPDGQREVVQHLRPVRARADGGWKPIDNTLEVRSDGSVGPKVAAIGMSFSGGGEQEPLAALERVGRKLAFTWPNELPRPTLNGDTATYTEVLPGIDLTLRADNDGYHQLLVVKSAAAAKNPELTELKLGMAAPGMEVRETADGGLEALDKAAGGVVFAAPQPIMWDSTGVTTGAQKSMAASEPGATGDATEGPGDSSQVAPIGLEVPSGGAELRLTPDQQLLTDADTQWPVYIDPQTLAPKAGDWTVVSRYWHSSPQYRFNGKSTEGVGDCEWSYCAPYDLKRLFYKFPTAQFAGKTILSAEFVAHETWSASCDGRAVELWRTKSMGPASTWDNSADDWLDYLTYRDVAYGGDGCAGPSDVEFNAIEGVKYAASHSDSYTTFGLKAKTETDKYGWKRFSDDAYLRVKFNLPPRQPAMSQLTMSPGGDCDSYTTPDWVRSRPYVTANNVTDPDKDRIGVQFGAWWDAGDGKGNYMRWSTGKPASTAFKASGSDFGIPLPSTIPANRQVSWSARVWDGAAYSPWASEGKATNCYFQYDISIPAGPKIVSAEYPGSMTGDPGDEWFDGVGRYGTFTFGPSSSDVVQYCYGINGDPACDADHKVATSGGAAKSVRIAPTEPGLRFITAVALDSAGNMSAKNEQTTYFFRAKTGQPARAQWKFDENAGATQSAGTAEDRTLAIHGQPTLGAPGAVGTAAAFDGTDDYLQSDIPTVDTSLSFSVSAWVNLSTMPAEAAVIAAQPGNNAPGFELYYSKSYDRWVFNQYNADSASATPVRVMQAAAGGVKANEWAHLVGLYNAGQDLLQLYVNGALAGSASYSTPWDARRGLQIGAGSYDGAAGAFFPGSIDEVRIFDKNLSQSEITALYNKQPIGSGRPARAAFSLDETPTTDQGMLRTELTGRADALPAVFQGGAMAGQASPSGKAAKFDGVDDYAKAGAPYVNTKSNFTVAAWVKLTSRPTQAAVVTTQPGAHKTAFELYYSATYGWSFNNYLTDTTNSTLVRAAQGDTTKAPVGEWTQLVGVYDKEAGRLRLYVNGLYVAGIDHTITWDASSPLQIGASRYDGVTSAFFPGLVDDVQILDRMVSTHEIADMYKARPQVEGRWKLNTASGTPMTSPDDVPADQGQHPLTLGGGAKIDPSGDYFGTGGGGLLMDPDGDGAVTGYASTLTSPAHTNTSFTATAWVTTPSRPQKPVTVMSQSGNNTNAFNVRYVPDPAPADSADGQSISGRWELAAANADTATATVVSAEHTNFQNETSWNHLTVAFDAFAGQLRLYVDGELRQSVCADDDGDGTPNEQGCTTAVSWTSQALPFDATKGLQLGRTKTGPTTWGEYWPGVIDDVWMFQGILSDTQIKALANGTELNTVPGP
ncbi:LamG domain-containing protein [Streptomyces sp. NBC_01336]|uniref:LamG-like jellyroll fold domain-containing protein n=1 Tax=Streptomyces sp. NBC_01336 TaxID=2903829 RepID=UPI002E10BC1C|nr:LamG domain-containing protein [Streptomyces sp. NBC_01336]